MSQENKEMDLSSLTQDQQNNLQVLQILFEQHKQNQLQKQQEQQKQEQQQKQEEQNQVYYAQSQNPPYYHSTPQQNYNYASYKPNGYPERMPEKSIQPEHLPNYQTAPHYAYFQPYSYPEKIPEKCIHRETAPNYRNTPGQVHEGDHGLGQHRPNYAYYQRNVCPEKLPEKGTNPGSELNYQTVTSQVHESDHGLGQQNPKHAYYRPNMCPEKLPEKGIEPGPEPNYQKAPSYTYCQSNGYPENIHKEGIMSGRTLNYQTAPGQGQGSVYNVGGKGGQNGDLGYQAPLGLSPAAEAAVVALTQLVQFTERMEGATWTGQGAGPAALPVSMGSGRRGGIPFEITAFGRGSGHNHEEPKRETPNPNKAPIPSYPCVLCKVDCNGLDVLEQHKNGKKHKKNMEKAGQIQLQIQPLALTTESKSVIEKTFEENAGIESSEKGKKRKMSGGQNGKRKRKANGLPRLVIPKICDLCNVKCDTEKVYEYHVAGKKHMSKVKRYEGHRSMYVPVGLQELYPSLSQTLAQQKSPQQADIGPQPGNMPLQAPNYVPEQVIMGVESSVTGLSS